MARISREPLTAAFKRWENPIFAICCEMLCRTGSPAAPSGISGSSGPPGRIDQRVVALAGRAPPGTTPRAAKNSPIAVRDVGPRQKRLERVDRNTADRRLGGRTDLRIGVPGEHRQDLDLLVGGRSERAFGRLQADVARRLLRV